ncbi:small ovary [Carabus blaptoides fortunei]
MIVNTTSQGQKAIRHSTAVLQISIGAMADDEYQRKLRDLQLYVPFLENTIRRLKTEAGKPREAQITKLQSLLAILTDTKKKLKFEALKKCEEVILKLYDKVEKKPAVETMHKYMCRNPPEEKGLVYSRTAVTVPTDDYSLDNEVSLSIARQKLHKQTDITTPASPSPPLNPPLLAPQPVVIPTEKVSPKGSNTYYIPVVDSFNSNQSNREFVEDGWCNNFSDKYQEPDIPVDIQVTLNNRPAAVRHSDSPRNWLGNEQLYQRRNDVSRPPLPDRFGVWKRMSFDEVKTTKPNREIVTYSDAIADLDLEDLNYHGNSSSLGAAAASGASNSQSSITKDLKPESTNRPAVTSPDTASKVGGKRTPIRICFNKDKDLSLPTSLNKPPLSESDLQDLLSTANESPSPPIVNDDMDLDKLEELRMKISKELEKNNKKGKDKHSKPKDKTSSKVPTPLTSPTAPASANSKSKTPRVVERVIKEQANIFGNLLSSIDEQIMVKKKDHKKVEKKDCARKEDGPKKEPKKSDSKESKDHKADAKHKDSKTKDEKHNKDKSKDSKSSSDTKHKEKSKSPKDTVKLNKEDTAAAKTALNIKDISKLNEKIKASFLKEDGKSKETDKSELKSAKSKDDSIFKDDKHKDESKLKGKHESKHKSSGSKSKDSSKDKEKCKTTSKDEIKDKNDKPKSAPKVDSLIDTRVTKSSDNAKSEQKSSDNNHSSSVSDSNSVFSDKKDDDKVAHSNRISDKYPHKRKTSTDTQKSQSEPKPLDVISKFISERIPMLDPKPKIPNTEVHPIKLADPRLRNHSELKSPTDARHFNHTMGDEESANMNSNFQNQFPNEQNAHRFTFPPQESSQTMTRPQSFMCEQNIRPSMFPTEQQMISNRPIFPHEAKQIGMINFNESQMDSRFNNFGPEHPNLSNMACNFNQDPHQMDDGFMNDAQLMNRNLFPNEMQQNPMTRPPSIESFHSSEMTPADPFTMSNEPFPGANVHLERGKSPFPSNFNNHDPRNHIPLWTNNQTATEQQFHMQQNQFNPGQNQGNCFPDRVNMVSPDFNTAQTQRFPNFPQNQQQRFSGPQSNQNLGHFGNMHDTNFDNTQYDLSQMNGLDFYDQNQDGSNPDHIPSLFDLNCEFNGTSNKAKRAFRGRGLKRGSFRGVRGERGGRGADRGGRGADRGNRNQFRWINPNSRASMNDEFQDEFPNRKFPPGSRFSNEEPKGNRFSSSDDGKDDYTNRKFASRFDDAKDEFANRTSDFRRRYDDEASDKRRSRLSFNDDKEYPARKYGNNRFSDDSKDGFSNRKFSGRFSGNEDSRKSHCNKFSSNDDSNEYSERKRFTSSEESKDDHHSRRFNSGSRFSSNDEPKEDQVKNASTATRSVQDESKDENSIKKATVESADKSSTKTESKEKEPVKPKDDIFSPLDSLYDPEKKKIGKGYGIQKFKIPKLKRNSVDEHKSATVVKAEDDKNIEENVKMEDLQQGEAVSSALQDETLAVDKNINEADQKLETFNNFMKQLFETSDSSVFLQFLDRFGCSLPKAKTKRIRRIIESESDESGDESKEKPEELNDKSSEVDDVLLKTPEKKPKEETESWDDSVVESVGERIKNRRRKKLDYSSESSPEKATAKKEDEELTNELEKEQVEDVKSGDDGGKKIAKTKRRNALELLQDDIRDMFISEGVLTATGHRMCRMMKEHQDSVLNSSHSELDSPQVKKKDPLTTSDDEDLPLARRKLAKKYKSKVDKNKVEPLEAPRLYPKRLRSSPRVLLEKLEKPELEKMIAQDDGESSDNSSDNEPLIKEIKRLGRPPKRVDTLNIGTSLDSSSTSETIPTEKKRGRPLSKRGRRKTVNVEVKLDETDKESIGESSTVSESPSKLENDQLSALAANHTVAKQVKKALGKKKRKSWAQGVIKRKPMKQLGKRQPSPSFSNADVSDQLSMSETTNDPEMGDVENETDNQEAENQSDNEEYSLLARDLTPDVNYFLDNGNKFDCKLCDYKGKFIVHHYKFKHPESENMISRLSPETAQTALNEAAANADYTWIVPFAETVKNKKRRTTFTCRFCSLTLKQENATNFFDHLTCHTGEYRYQCDTCSFYSGSRKALSAHINHEHPSYKRPLSIVPVFPAPPNFRIVFGFLCKACNFTQLLRTNVEQHIKVSHPEQDVDIIKISLSSKPVSLADINRDEPNETETVTVTKEPEEKIVELPKEPDMTVFMVPEDISVREKLIEDERLKKMQEVISNITPRRSTLQFVDKLKTKLDKAQIDKELHEEITIEDVTTEEQISVEEVAQVMAEVAQEKLFEITSTCSLASAESDVVINDTPSEKESVSVQPSVLDSTMSDLVIDTTPSDTESVADTEEPIDVTNVELNLPTDSKQKGVLDTIQRLAAQLQTSPAKTAPIADTTTPPAAEVEPRTLQFESELKAPEIQQTQPSQNELSPTQSVLDPDSILSHKIWVPRMVKPAPTPQPSDGEVIINVGPIEVRLNQKDAHYYCLVEGCKFSSAYKISFTKHCSDQHQKLMFNCDICQRNGEPARLCTMMSLFVHLFDKHKENSKPKPVTEKEKSKTEPAKIRLRRISGDVLSTPCADVKADAQPQPAAVQPEMTLVEIEKPGPPPGFLQIIDVRTLTPEEENITYGSARANATDTSPARKIAVNSRIVFSPKHVLIPVTEVAKYSKIVDNLNQKPTKIVKVSKPNAALTLKKTESTSVAQTAVVKPSTSATAAGKTAPEPVKPRLVTDGDDMNLAFNELKTSKTKEVLQEMLKLPKISDLYKCPLETCAYSTKVKKQFETHFNNHNCTAMGYYCVYCMSVVRSGNLLGHIDSKHGHCLFQCAYCFYRSIVASYVIIHQKKYHCKESVRVIQLPKNHAARTFLMNNIERPIPRKQTILPYICNQDKCKSTFLIVDEFMTHLQSTHKWYFLCSRCQTSAKYSTPASLITHYAIHCIAMYQQYNSRFIKSSLEEDRLQEVNLDKLNVNVINTLSLAGSTECSSTDPSTSESSITIHSSVDTGTDRKKHIIESVLIEDSPKQSTQVIDVIDLSDDAPEPEITENTPTTPAMFGEPMVTLKHRTVASSIAVATAVDPLNLDEPDTRNENSETLVVSEPTIRLIEDIIKFSEDAQTSEQLTEAKDDQDADKLIVDVPLDNSSDVGTPEVGFSGRDLFRCGTPDCNFQTLCLRDFKSHMFKCDVLKTNEGWYSCAHCPKRFKSASGIVDHIQIHGLLRFSCSMCTHRATLCHLIAQHMKIEHKVLTIRLVPVDPVKNDLNHDRFVANPTRMNQSNDLIIELPATVDETPVPVEDKNMFGPDDIERLPRPPVYAQEIKCKLCTYCTKVRSNMQRHLQQHIDEKTVPETAPVNPVPCLEKNEKMFDKMTNLAASSHTGRMGAKAGEKSDKGLTKEEETTLPGFVPVSKRYVCGAEGCSYLTHGDTMLRQHFTTLHSDVSSYKCPHCQVELLTDEDGLTIDNILFHLKMHDLHLYKCSHCSFYHYQKHKLDKHISDKHPDRIPYMHVIRELDNSANQQDTRIGTAVKPTIDAQAELKPWRCGFCTYATNNRTDVQNHAFQMHNIKSQFKCGVCQFRCSAKNNYQSHFKTKHPNCEINILSVYYKLTEEDLIKKPHVEPIPEPETFDTTPLWSRDKPRIRHIRGILLDESKSSKKSSAKVDKSIVDLNKSSVEKTNEDTVTVGGKLNTDKKSIKPNVLDASRLPANYGVPVKSFYVCPVCEKYRSKSVKEFVVHLYMEMSYFRCACSMCDFKCVDINLAKQHWTKYHSKATKDETIIPLQPDGKIERWVEKCVQHQQKAMKNMDEPLNSPTLILQLDEASNIIIAESAALSLETPFAKEPVVVSTETSAIDNLDSDATPPKCSTPILSLTEVKTSLNLDTTDIEPDANFSVKRAKTPVVKNLQCDHCTFIAKTVQTLRKHIKRHFIHKPFRCNCCKFQAINRQSIIAHFHLRHKQAQLSFSEVPAPDQPVMRPLKRKRYAKDPLEPPRKILALDATATLDTELIELDARTNAQDNTEADTLNVDAELNESVEIILDLPQDKTESKTTTENTESEDKVTDTATDNVTDADKLLEKPVKGKAKKKVMAKMDNTEKSETVTYICYHCPRRSDNLDTIRNHFISIHEKVHKGCFKYKKLTVDKTKQVKRYNCKYCSWSGLPDGLKQHHLELHNDKICVFEKATRFKCNDCQEIFPKVHLLRKHFQSMHPDASLSYRSVLDDNGDNSDLLDSVVILEEQLDIQPESKVLQCEYCPDTFQDTTQLMNHHSLLHSHLELKLDSDEQKKFKCPSCGHTSNSYPAMRDHLRSHNKPYKCHYCSLTGSYPSIIKTHHVKEHRSLEFKYDSNPDAKKMNEELRENLLILGEGGTYHVKNALKRQSSDLELPASKIIAVTSFVDLPQPSTSTAVPVKRYNVAKKSTSLPPKPAAPPPQRVAKKSTTPRAVKPQTVEGYSFYRSKPCDIDEYKNVMSEINIMGKSMPINVVAMSHVLNLFPKVIVEDCNKTHRS